MILAHRGDSSRAPENTIEAARLGREAGADGWELDVQLSRDGVPVVLHDESLVRTTDVEHRFGGDPRGSRGFLVGEFSAEEIRTLDAGSWFVDPAGGTRTARAFGSSDKVAAHDRAHYASGRVRVPTLAEALKWTVRHGWMVNVEIKPTADDPEPLVDAVLHEVRRSGAFDLVSISSFDLAIVRSVLAHEPRVATGALFEGWPGLSPGEIRESIGADALHLPVGAILANAVANPPGVAQLSGGLLPILAYTLNDAGSSGPAPRLAAVGVSGLFTDDPARFRDLPHLSRS